MVRVRFAPSPTGALHIGGVRTALYNYLFAKKNNGTFILRIEDTDQTRFVEGAEKYISEALEWCGIIPDESPFKSGPYAPYRQSERKEIYKDFASKLVNEDKAYYAFDTPEELDAMRERLKAARVPSPQYNSITRMTMKNSLTLPEDEVKRRLNEGEPYVIRIKVPKKEEIRLNDMVRGWVMVHSSALDDKVLMKGDGMPTYHLANVVDDHLMKISHVIRGEEWLPSAPLHLLLYKFLGLEDSIPKFAHLPLLLKPDGNGKLSKRDAEKYGFPIFPLQWKDPHSGEIANGFREDGFLSSAFVNFLAFLGWNPGHEREFYLMDDLIKDFSIERIGKSGTKFDIDKVKWLNQQHIKSLPNKALSDYLAGMLKENKVDFHAERLDGIVELLKERVLFIKDLYHQGSYFFMRPQSYDYKVATKKWGSQVAEIIEAFALRLRDENDITADKAKSLLVETVDLKGSKLGKVMPALRLAITGAGSGPDLMSIMEVLGNKEVFERIYQAIRELSPYTEKNDNDG